jgi:signal transduction histidine kinase
MGGPRSRRPTRRPAPSPPSDAARVGRLPRTRTDGAATPPLPHGAPGLGYTDSVSTRVLRGLFLGIAIFVLAVITGMTGILYELEARHSRAIDVQSEALGAISAINAAQAVVHSQRVLVASGRIEPLNRQAFRQKSTEFERLLHERDVATTTDASAIKHLDSQYGAFVQAALALPDSPTAAEVLAAQAKATAVTRSMDRLRVGHHTDLGAIVRTEREQRQLAGVVLLTADSTILVLVAAGFAFLDRLAKERSRREVLEVTDRLRSEFVSFAAHELRNPAATINAGVYLLHQPEADQEVREKALDSMAQSSAALGRLVMNLLNMGRIEEGQLRLHRESLPLAALLDGLVKEMGAYQEGTRRQVQVEVPEVLVNVDADYARLAIANVLDNAVKYSPPEAPIRVTGTVREGMVEICIIDQGPGIAPEHLAHVFDKYETTEISPHGTHRGTGLGLYMARLLVEAHSGRIWAESPAGEGTTVCLTLPLAALPEERPATPKLRLGRHA